MLGGYYIGILITSFVCVITAKIIPEITREIGHHNPEDQRIFQNENFPPEMERTLENNERDNENHNDVTNWHIQNSVNNDEDINTVSENSRNGALETDNDIYDITNRDQRNSGNNDDVTTEDFVNGGKFTTNTLIRDRNPLDGDFAKERKEERWVIVTGKYTKKLRKTNFKNFKIEKTNILGTFALEREWKSKIVDAISNGHTTVKTSIRRPTLKSSNGNALTILSDDATMRKSSSQRDAPQYNVTCSVVEQYTCMLQLTREVVVPCQTPPWYQCIERRQESRKANCQRRFQKCCEGYQLAPSGYCERPKPVSPPTPTPTLNVCGGYLTSREGVITSPNYPRFYPNDQNCTWTVKAPNGYKVVLKVVHLAVEDPVGACDLTKWECFKFCEFDRLKITDVTTGNLKTLCGSRVPTSQYISSGNSVHIAFESDVSTGGRGFKIVYAIVSEYELSTHHSQCMGGQTWQVCYQRCARTCQRHNNGTTIMCIENGNRYKPIPFSSRNDMTCVPGCACPPDKPVWHQGSCIKPESCPGDFFKCGKPAVESKLKIVGGRVAGKYAWPWMVQIESKSLFHICGATLICSNWIVTAAHCFLNFDRTDLDLTARKYLVNVGKYWKDDQIDGRIVQTYDPDEIIAHPDYRVNTDTNIDINDIAMIKLSRAVDVTDHVRPACLPHPIIQGVTSEISQYAKYQQPTTGTSCRVLGWGTTKGIGPNYEKLKEASISIQPGSDCVYSSYDWKLMICAGGHQDEDTCRGDSGGPLLCKRRNGEWFLDGVTSFGNSCGEKGVAGGYTRISSYIGWIRSYTGYHCES